MYQLFHLCSSQKPLSCNLHLANTHTGFEKWLQYNGVLHLHKNTFITFYLLFFWFLHDLHHTQQKLLQLLLIVWLNEWLLRFFKLPGLYFFYHCLILFSFFKVWYEIPPTSTLVYSLSNASSCCSQNTIQFQCPMWYSVFPFRQIRCTFNGKMLFHLSTEVKGTMTSIHN